MTRMTVLSTLAFALCLAVAGCDPGLTLVPAGTGAATDTTGSGPDGTDTTVVVRGTLTVTAVVAGHDSALAAQLGWTTGVPGAEVRAFRLGQPELRGVTDAAAQVTFPSVLPGAYQISILRLLSEAERAALGAEHADVDALGGGGTATLVAPATGTAVSVRATRRGTLVISENFPSTWLGSQSYRFGTFVEVYNNGSDTIFLDGKLFGFGPFFVTDRPENGRPCSLTQQWQADPDGLWTTRLWRFPGTGQQYPLAPGEAAVVATDAVDHSLVDPRWPNLSNARFEFVGSADSDNPGAANMIQVGTPAFSDVLGHGPWFTGGSAIFIATNVDVATLPHVQPPGYVTSIPRIPRDSVLDVIVPLVTFGTFGYTPCEKIIHEVFDTGPWEIVGTSFMSIRRRWLGSALLRTGSTLNDFEVIAAPTPGTVP
ncbi:MAG: hypothetical protein WD934_06505 [Gemmatimonadales bacterium]